MIDKRFLPSILFAIVYSTAWGGLASAPTSLAQVTTSITPDNSLGTTVTQDGNVFNIDNGAIFGPNQFQSFGEFNLGDGDIASFNGPSGIENVLSRVTGGDPSNIFGTLRSTIDRANLFFMNPAGVIFGPTASLEISGSFHTTTADFLKLGEDGIFYASLGEDSVLTVAGVEAFGFVNPKPSNISVERSSLFVPNGETFSLVGGEISLLGNPGTEIPSVVALEGQINLVSVASPGEVTFSETGEPIVSSFNSLGDINMSENAFITLEDFEGTNGGTVMIRGGRFVMENAAIFNETYGDRAGGPVSIVASKEVSIGETAFLFTSTFGDGDGGLLEIQAPVVNLSGNVQIQAGTAGGGEGGPVTFSGDSVSLSGEAFVTSPSAGPANAGTVSIMADTVTFSDNASIQNQAFAEGDGGAVDIQAQTVTFRDRGGIQTSGSAQFSSEATGNAANINITTNNLTMKDTSLLESGTETAGQAGNITIEANTVMLQGNLFIEGGTAGTGNGGSVMITAETLTLSEGAAVQSVTAGPGNAGQVSLNVDQLNISGGAKVSSAAMDKSSGFGGTVTINSMGPVSISGQNSGIFSSSDGENSGGQISLTANEVSLEGEATISAQSSGPGDAGNIFINAGDQFISQDSFVTTEAAQADGGDIEIQAISLVQLVNSDLTATVRGGEGAGGNILVDPNAIIVENSRIIANAFGGPGGNIDLISNVFLIDQSSVISASSQFNTSGNVNIRASTSVLAETIAPLPKNFVSPASLYASPCVAQQGGQLSSFVQRPRDMAPPQPEDLWASPLFLELPHVAPSQSGVSLKEPSTNLSLRFADFLNFSPHFPSTQPRPSMLLTGCRIS